MIPAESRRLFKYASVCSLGLMSIGQTITEKEREIAIQTVTNVTFDFFVVDYLSIIEIIIEECYTTVH